MNSTKGKEVAVVDDALEALRAQYPTEPAFNRAYLPRIGMISQDKTEDKGKTLKVVAEAGTFYIERQAEKEDKETGKKPWIKEELGTEFEGTIVFQRKQLRHFDEGSQTFTSSPIYDQDDEIVSLFANKAQVGRGTPEELKALPEFEVTKDGKKKSALEDNAILYVLYEGEVFQMNLRGSSMYSFKTWRRKLGAQVPPELLVKFSSEAMEKGSINWNKMTFETIASLGKKALTEAMEHVATIKEGVAQEKAFFARKKDAEEEDGDDDGKTLPGGRKIIGSGKKF